MENGIVTKFKAQIMLSKTRKKLTDVPYQSFDQLELILRNTEIFLRNFLCNIGVRVNSENMSMPFNFNVSQNSSI